MAVARNREIPHTTRLFFFKVVQEEAAPLGAASTPSAPPTPACTSRVASTWCSTPPMWLRRFSTGRQSKWNDDSIQQLRSDLDLEPAGDSPKASPGSLTDKSRRADFFKKLEEVLGTLTVERAANDPSAPTPP